VWSDRIPVKAQNKYVSSQRPARYLKRIVALTGARKVHGERYMLAVGRKYFLVGAKFVHRLSRSGKSTCFSLLADVDTPRLEPHNPKVVSSNPTPATIQHLKASDASLAS
jgi:hypothetical protein